MTIRIYPSTLEGEPIETYQWSGTIAGWFDHRGLDLSQFDIQPVEVKVNGTALDPSRWADTAVSDSDDVSISVIQNGGVLEGLGSIIGSVFNTVFGWLMPSAAGAQGMRQTPSGEKLPAAEGRANQAKLGEVVPELAGRFRRYPEYLTPPRRYFASPREQWLKFMVCIGPGEYEIFDDGVKVGDTPISSLGGATGYVIYPPNADLSGETANEHWHTVKEVGGTSSGTAGLELVTESGNRDNTQPGYYTLSSDTVVRSEGEYPTAWGSNTAVTVQYPRRYNVEDISVPETETEASYEISEITGYFGHIPNMDEGELIQMGTVGSDDFYRIRELTSLGAGVYTIRLEDRSGDPLVIAEGPARGLIFGADIPRTISAMSSSSITVSPGGFEAGTATDVVVRFQGGEVYGEWSAEIVATPGNETTAELELDFFFPQGLTYIRDSGGLNPQSVTIEFRYRPEAGGAWTYATRTYVQSTRDQIGFTERITIPAMRPVVQCRRLGATSESTQVVDTVHWYALKSRLQTRNNYPNWTTMAVFFQSGGKLGAQSENQVNVIATRRLPELQSDGTWSVPNPTRRISAFAAYIARSIGYDNSNLDISALIALDAEWNSRGDTFNHVFDETTVKAALNTVFAAGMAEFTVAQGKIRPVKDGPRTQFEQSYSPQNMVGPLVRTFTSRRHDDPDYVQVEYIDGTTWAKETVICEFPGSARTKPLQIRLDGVVDRGRAWRIGMRRLREVLYQRWEYSFKTEMDAFNSEYGGYVALFDDIPGYGQSMLMTEILSVGPGWPLVRVTEPLVWVGSGSHVMAFMRRDGSVSGPWEATPGPDDYSMYINYSGPWPTITLSEVLPNVYFGPAERFTFPAIVRRVTPNGSDSATVLAVNYDSRIYADDNNWPT